ncbi:CU044_5270 family protein [Streptomyces sp. NBC_01237]|uniref:CU044_5270 family protein n=1 Tax=Streptomyces sp. NBC_01237 TaxID=2903790 RepID=UPI002DDAD1BC|nr:CU044_5270 family protein [Streptomyces sp. NBC_01237]WRZ76394.1 CU044_5270 family protein [Streptomyces sp. NBC_01237]
MNPQQQEQSEREQASRTLPPPPAPEPAPGRVAARRVHFLSEIDRQTPARSYRPMLRPGKRWGLALGTAVAAAASIAVLSLGSGSPAAPAKVPPASAASVQLLERAALVAAATPQTKARAGQYTYIKTVGHTSVLSETKTGEMALLRQDEGMEQWTSVDGSAQTLQRKNGSDTLLPGNPGQGNLNSPTYNLLDGLPTDPEALLKRISDDAEENHGAGSESTTGPHQEAFVTIGDLLRNGGTPPDTTAALYRAAALIPGVDVVPDAVDAAGRHGVAVARTHDGERIEWIFDESTVRLLGERTVLVEDNAWGKAGTVVTSVALIDSGIVDEAGQTD